MKNEAWYCEDVVEFDVAVEVGLIGAGHVAVGALVMVDVRAHVVAEVAVEREHLLAVSAAMRHLRDRGLTLAVVVELGSVGEQTSAPEWTTSLNASKDWDFNQDLKYALHEPTWGIQPAFPENGSSCGP